MADLTLAEASVVLRLSPQTVRQDADSGALPCARTAGGHRRFAEADLLAYRSRDVRAPAEAGIRAAIRTTGVGDPG